MAGKKKEWNVGLGAKNPRSYLAVLDDRFSLAGSCDWAWRDPGGFRWRLIRQALNGYHTGDRRLSSLLDSKRGDQRPIGAARRQLPLERCGLALLKLRNLRTG